MTAAAIAVGAGLSFISGQQQAGAQASANRQNVALTREELAQQQGQFETGGRIGAEQAQSKRDFGVGQLGAFGQAGQAASQQQQALLGMGTPEEQQAAFAAFGDSPGQKFIRDRAQKNLLRSSAAIGGLGGGNVRRALVEQGAGFAAQDFDRQLGRLGEVAGRGQQAAQQLTASDLGVSETALGLAEPAVEAPAAQQVAAPAAAQQPAGPSSQGLGGGPGQNVQIGQAMRDKLANRFGTQPQVAPQAGAGGLVGGAISAAANRVGAQLGSGGGLVAPARPEGSTTANRGAGVNLNTARRRTGPRGRR